MDETIPTGSAWAPSGTYRRSRSSHSKSRTGCLTCKLRRVKVDTSFNFTYCDETRPICNNCSSRKTECHFPDNFTVIHKAEASGPVPTNPITGYAAENDMMSESPGTRLFEPQLHAGEPGLDVTRPSGNRKRSLGDQLEHAGAGTLSQFLANSGPQTATFDHGSWGDMESLGLLSQFITRTHITFSLLEVKQHVWKDAVIPLSSTSECLMHALLAVSAMHSDYLSRTNLTDTVGSQDKSPSGRTSPHSQASTLHHNLAVSLMRKEVASLSEANIQQVFAASTALVAFSFATSQAGSRQESSSLTWPDLDWFRLTRGISSITAQAWPSLRMGPLRRLMDVRVIHEDWKLHLQGREALHREPSLPIQLPQPTYMQLNEVQSTELRTDSPEPQPNTVPDSWVSNNPLYEQLSRFRLGADAAISELLEVCSDEIERAEKSNESVAARGEKTPASSEVNADEKSCASDRSAVQKASLVLKDLYIRTLLMFQYSSYCSRMQKVLNIKESESSAQALQEIEEVGALSWPAMVPEDYVRELSQVLPNPGQLEGGGLTVRARLRCNRAKALVVLAYYKVLLVLLGHGFWWLDQFGSRGISVIAAEVEGSFAEAISVYDECESSKDKSVGEIGDELRRVKSEAEIWLALIKWPLTFVTG